VTLLNHIIFYIKVKSKLIYGIDLKSLIIIIVKIATTSQKIENFLVPISLNLKNLPFLAINKI